MTANPGSPSIFSPSPAAGFLKRLGHWVSNHVLAFCAGSLMLGGAAGYFYGHQAGFNEAADRRRQLPNGSILCKPGPWGNVSYTPFTIAAPDDLLPVRGIEEAGTDWFFKGYTSDAVVSLFQSAGMGHDLQLRWIAPSVFHIHDNGIELTPTPDLVYSLPDDTRAKIYEVLSQFPENDSQVHFLRASDLDEHFAGSGVAPASIALFKQLCCQRGDYLMYAGLSALLGRLPSYEEKLRFVKALTRERTMLLRIHITPQSDLDALAQYWGIGQWGTDVKTIFESLSQIPTGTWMNITMVLPPLPTSEIYSFPNIADGAAEENRDCHWTSLNFFRATPDPNFDKPGYGLRELRQNYVAAPGDPRYGDLVLFAKPDGAIVHSAIYIADDICFTKNGDTDIHPWMLSTISDLIGEYSFEVDPDQKLVVQYFRDKAL